MRKYKNNQKVKLTYVQGPRKQWSIYDEEIKIVNSFVLTSKAGQVN